jgi:PHD/YefM family antitoxin component YafN of YafNO toxin-antitoxin module
MSELEKVPPAVPVSELGKRSDAVLEQIKQSHVLITRQGKEAGVLVHPTVWNRMVDYIDELECLVAALEVERDLALGKTQLIPIDPDAWEAIRHDTAETKPTRQKEKVLA